MTAAEIRVVGQSGVFIADDCRIEGDVVRAIGRFRRRTGANYAEFRFSERRSMTWSLRRCDVRWIEAEVTA